MSKFEDRLTSLGYSSYEEYLASDHWAEFKRRYFASTRPKTCMVCGAVFELQLHHYTYKRLGNERLTDVTCLCYRHHQEVHEHLKSKRMPVEATTAAVVALRKAGGFVINDGLGQPKRVKGRSNPSIGRAFRDYYRRKKAEQQDKGEPT